MAAEYAALRKAAIARACTRLHPDIADRAPEAADAIDILGSFPGLWPTTQAIVGSLLTSEDRVDESEANAIAHRCWNPACTTAGDALHSSGKKLEERLGIANQVKMQICGACRIAVYCGLDCQKAHWKDHKSFCKEKKAQREAGAVSDSAPTASATTAMSRIGTISLDMGLRQAFNKISSNLMHGCAGTLGTMFLAWRCRLYMGQRAMCLPPIVIVEIDHKDAAANEFQWPFRWSAYPYYPVLQGIGPVPNYEGPRPDVNKYLNDLGVVRQYVECWAPGKAMLGVAGGKQRSVSEALRSGEVTFVVTLTSALHPKFTRLQLLAHHADGQDALLAGASGSPGRTKGKSRWPGNHVKGGQILHQLAFYAADSILLVEPATPEEQAVPRVPYTFPRPELGTGAPRRTPTVLNVPTKVTVDESMHDACMSSQFTGNPDHVHEVERIAGRVFSDQSFKNTPSSSDIRRWAWPVLVPWREDTRPVDGQ